jgi:hypothetical protein
VTAPDPNPFVDCGVIIFQGGATRFDRQLASTIHCVDDEIIKCLKRRERGAAGDLGDDVQLTVERGARNFASGDRIMFLQNERGLGVKNGTLGTIEQVSAQSMTVQTDDGRSVPFDMKDYNKIDHGLCRDHPQGAGHDGRPRPCAGHAGHGRRTRGMPRGIMLCGELPSAIHRHRRANIG